MASSQGTTAEITSEFDLSLSKPLAEADSLPGSSSHHRKA